MSDDGSIVFRVDADDQDAQKKLSKLHRDIEKTAKVIEGTTAKRNGITESLDTARAAAEKTAQEIQKTKDMLAKSDRLIGVNTAPGSVSVDDYNRVIELQDKLVEKQKTLETEYKKQMKEVEKLEGQEQKVVATLEQQNNLLRQQKSEAGAVERVLSSQSKRTLPDLAVSAESAGNAFKKGFRYLLKWGFGIRSTFILFRKLKAAVKESITDLAKYDKETKDNIISLKASLLTLKASWGAAFAPIFNVVAPYVRKLIDWMVAGANAVQMFFAVLSGKSSYKKAIADNVALADSYGAAGSAAKDATKDIMGFDEINKLSDESSGGGGGGGSDDVNWEDTPIESNSLAARLALEMKDVLFNWDDLTPEDVARKCVAGLCTFMGGAAGFTIAGVPGAIVGTLAGFALGCLINSVVFDHDGQISADELRNLLLIGLGGFIGGIMGFSLGGGIGGAFLGATVGMSLSLAILSLIKKDGGIMVGDFEKIVKTALAGLIGAAIGMSVLPGVGGALIGAAVGISLSLAFGGKNGDDVEVGDFGGSVRDKLIDSIMSTDFWVLHNVLNYKLGEEVFGKKLNDWYFSQGDYEGKEIIMGFIHGVDKETPKAETNMKKNSKKTVSAWWNSIKERWPVEETWIYKAIHSTNTKAGSQAESETKDAGKKSTKGFWSGMEERWPVEETWIYKAFPGLVNSVRKILGIASPSTVFSDIGKNIVDGLVNGARNVWNNVTNFFSQGIRTVRNLMNFSWSFPAPKMPHFTWYWQNVGNLVSIPRFSIEWYGKGGVFDQAQLIGVGENGSEAVVPLEKNTGWMRTVADGIASRLIDSSRFADAISGRTLPAYANGSITPPGAIGRDFESLADSVTEAITVALDRAFAAESQSGESERPIILMMDGKEIARSTTKYQRQFLRAAG